MAPNGIIISYTPLKLSQLSSPQNIAFTEAEKELAQVNKDMYERNFELAIRNRTLSVLREMYEIINTSLGIEKTCTRLIEAIVKELKFQKGFIALCDKESHSLRTIALSSSPENVDKDLPHSKHPFKHFNVSLKDRDNFCVASVVGKHERMSNSLYDVLVPLVTEDEAITIESMLKIQTTVIYPIIFANKVLGTLVLCLDKHVGLLSRAEVETMKELMDVVAIAVERAQIYADLKLANEKLKELDHLKDEFVSVASHELRTPMTAVKSYLWMALNGKGGELNEKQKYYLDRAYMSTDRLIKLVNDMLNVSRIEAGRVSLSVDKVDLNTLSEEVIAEVKPRADELGLTIKLVKVSDLPPVIADSDKIKEVLINFIGNSLKFTLSGGVIEINFVKKEDMIITNVIDNGKGIMKEYQAKLFEKFGIIKGSYTTTSTSQGTGLGLYICKSIIKMHKGEIWAASEGKDKGSTFSFSLKVYNPKDLKLIQAEQESKEGKDIIRTAV
ncbi:MAG: HAMP domain-containing sensor histidine kinase [Patescibacteria group bacterium]